MPDLTFENRLRRDGFTRIAGVDEVGRGPLAGPVVVAAVILPNDFGGFPPNVRIDDSKRLTPRQLEIAYNTITDLSGILYSVAVGDNRRIDDIGILQTTFECMTQCVTSLSTDAVLIDGNQCPTTISGYTETVVKGDSRVLSIACASIIAKVRRDRLMRQFNRTWAMYGFDRHKGYGTSLHISTLRTNGPCPIHRRSFNPLKTLLRTCAFTS